MLDEVLKQVAVLGAAGKMGSGISLLLLQEIARLEMETTEDIGSGDYRLVLIDANEMTLHALSASMKQHLVKYAERHINKIRRCFQSKPNLISNAEIIQYFVEGALRIAQFETSWQAARNSRLIFEAIIENLEIKTEVLTQIARQGRPDAFYFSNTSSIPIHVLNHKAHLDNRLIGFHFYNPPVIQKLIELIIPESVHPEAVSIANQLAKRLEKIVVISKDVAGFIGNGFFIREAMFAAQQVTELSRKYSLPQAIYLVNKVTQDFLIRPMGIFQLIDYVGIDVFASICQVMNTYISGELFEDPLFDKMISLGIMGGQKSDGAQKNGFFQYDGSNRSGIYSIAEQHYLPLTNPWISDCDHELGGFPAGHVSWNKLKKDPAASEKLKNYFLELAHDQTLGAELARQYLLNCKDIAKKLVQTHVAKNINDVGAVLRHGFYHLYSIEEIEISLNLRC